MSLQTISAILSNLPTAKPTNLFFDNKEPIRKFDTDPVALGVAMKRLQANYGLKDHAKHLTPEDKAQAETIREYYRKKYFWNALKSQATQSDYRMRVTNLLQETKEWELTERDTGIFVKLPYFYDEDTMYDEFKKLYKTQHDQYFTGEAKVKETKLLTHIGTTFRWQAVKRKSFWFKDSKDLIYAVSVVKDTPFISLFEDAIKSAINVEFKATANRVDGMFYNEIGHNFKIVKE